MLKKVKNESDVLAEAAKHLTFLYEKFTSALQRRDFSDEDLHNIYTNEELHSPEFHLDQNRLNLFVQNRRRDLNYPFKTFLEITQVVCLERTDFEVEFDEEFGFGIGNYDLTSKLLTKFSSLYFDKVYSLIRHLSATNLKQHWSNVLAEGGTHIELLRSLEKFENDFRNQRDICTFYYELTAIVKDNNLTSEIDLSIEENRLAYSHLFDNDMQLGNELFILGEADPLRQELAVLERRGAQFFLKFTLLEDREAFLNAMKAILKLDTYESAKEQERILKDLPLFIDNNFHFNNSIYTTKISNHNKPTVKANDLAVLLRIYLDNSKLIGATKKDVIAWLAHEFYGQRGFTSHNLKGYLERKALTRNHTESGHTIIKGFEKRFPKI